MHKKNYRLLSGGVAASLLATLTLVGGMSTGSASATGKTFTIGSDVNDLTNPFLAAVAVGEKQEAAKLGMKIKVLSGNTSGSISLSQEIANIQTFVSEKVNLILVTPSNSVAIEPALAKAAAAHIPVIAVNEPVGVIKGSGTTATANTGTATSVKTFVGDDDYTYGVLEAQLTVKAIGGKGDIALLHGVLGTSADTLRFAGMNSVFKKYPNIHIVTTMVDAWVNATDITDVQDLMAKYGAAKLAAVVAIGPQMYAGAEYARAHGDMTTKFIAGDYSREVATAIKSGAVYGTVDQSPAEEGVLGVQYGMDVLLGKMTLVPHPTADIPLPIVTKANVNSIPALWNS